MWRYAHHPDRTFIKVAQLQGMPVELQDGCLLPTARQYSHTVPAALAAHVPWPGAQRWGLITWDSWAVLGDGGGGAAIVSLASCGGLTPEPWMEAVGEQPQGTRLPAHLGAWSQCWHRPTLLPAGLRTK